MLAILPIILSFVLLAAHFFRFGQIALVALALLLPLLLLVRTQWAARVMQVALLLGAAEWVRTIIVFASARMAVGYPYLRMTLILGAVALFTAGSALLFRMPSLRARFGQQQARPRP
jgi:hypothetical protein